MDADKWSRYYQRTKNKEGFEEAAHGLVSGMLRELYSRIERAGRFVDHEEIAHNVDDMYREVAGRHQELREEGFVDLVEKTAPTQIARLFKAKAAK